MFKLLTLLALIQSIRCDFSDGHYHWLVGDPNDYVVPNPSRLLGGVVMAGGGGDVDSAMRWFLNRAAGGDVIVMRNADNGTTDLDDPEADRYNAYFYSQLGVRVNSVETILFNGKWVAQNPIVVEKIRRAEAIFFSGGDQATYYEFLEGTPLLAAINEIINAKRAVIGGTSAGCAIQTQFGFTAEFDTIDSASALNNPYDKRVTISGNLFRNKWLENTIVDQHYDNRNRQGRHVAFMARVLNDHLKNTTALVRGIGVDELTAVCLDKTYGIASVFGSQYAYFVQQMNANFEPEVCEPNKPLEWNHFGQALSVYRIKADDTGSGHFDLTDWSGGFGGTWMSFYVKNGQFFMGS